MPSDSATKASICNKPGGPTSSLAVLGSECAAAYAASLFCCRKQLAQHLCTPEGGVGLRAYKSRRLKVHQAHTTLPLSKLLRFPTG